MEPSPCPQRTDGSSLLSSTCLHWSDFVDVNGVGDGSLVLAVVVVVAIV